MNIWRFLCPLSLEDQSALIYKYTAKVEIMSRLDRKLFLRILAIKALCQSALIASISKKRGKSSLDNPLFLRYTFSSKRFDKKR